MTGPHRSDRLHRGLTEQLRSPHINASIFRRTGVTDKTGCTKSDWLEQPVQAIACLRCRADSLLVESLGSDDLPDRSPRGWIRSSTTLSVRQAQRLFGRAGIDCHPASGSTVHTIATV